MSIYQITEHCVDHDPAVKSCLLRGVINYTALAKYLLTHHSYEKDTKLGAVIIALQRFKRKHRYPLSEAKKREALLRNSEIEIKTKIAVVVIHKKHVETIELEKKITRAGGYFQAIAGRDTVTIITSENYMRDVIQTYRDVIVRKQQNLVLFTIKSPENIETVPGVVSYLYSLLAMNQINVVETMSCWTDTMFVVTTEDFNKTVDVLQF